MISAVLIGLAAIVLATLLNTLEENIHLRILLQESQAELNQYRAEQVGMAPTAPTQPTAFDPSAFRTGV
jgi:hypothetical protein